MKKMLLIIALAFCIFQMVVLAVAIDMGNPAVNKASNYGSGTTIVDRNNPANASGTITSVEIYATLAMSGVEIGIFSADGNVLTTRSSEAITDVVQYYSQHTVSLEVEEGDYIGLYWTGGNLDLDNVTVCTGCWYFTGDQIPCTDITFIAQADRTISLYGTGATPVVGITWNGITITKWNGQTITIPLNTQ